MAIGNRYSQHSFSQTPSVGIPRSTFDRSFGLKDTFQFDKLIPIFVDEVLPGDTCNVMLNHFTRLQPMVVPVMDNMYLDFFFFFVPNRLVWNNWERFNGAQDDPGDSTDYLVPQVSTGPGGATVGQLFDKFGIPTGVPNLSFNVLPIRAYKLIWNEWFRDQNLQNSLVVDKGDGPDAGFEQLLPRAKKHDYFTSALPWPQKGPAVEIPLGSTMPIMSNGNTIQMKSGSDASNRSVFSSQITGGTGNTLAVNGSAVGSTAQVARFGDETGLVGNLNGAIAGTINELRTAFQMQSLFELDARGGTRYTEILLAHFNVTSPDFRLQRPEYLGGGQSYINTHPVAQTSASEGDSPQANLAAFATSSNQGHIGFTKSFVEHGYVIGLVAARADITYQQGLNKMWTRKTRFDFFWPKLQELGEQAILNKEIMATGVPLSDDAVFGYQERYAEYRYKPSEVHGAFRSTYSLSLDVWHLAEEFGTVPPLSDLFIQSSTPINRALAVTDQPPIMTDMFFRYKHSRPMLTYSTPASLGRF